MIDLTPLDVRKKKGDFRKKPLGGYDPEEVDNFLGLVEERLEELVKENLSLSERLRGMETRLATLEGRENAVQEALVSAQALRKEVQDQTLKDAEALEEQSRREIQLRRREAEAEIDARLREAEELLKERQRALEELERNRRKFLKAFRSLLERELDSVEVEEARRPLEDTPLDLQLRGWSRPDTSSAAGEGSSGKAGAEGPEPLWLSSLLERDEEGAGEGDEAKGSDPDEEGTEDGHGGTDAAGDDASEEEDPEASESEEDELS